MLPLAASGLFGVTIYFFFESRGIKLTSASHASLIIAVIPVVTVIAEALLFRTRISWLTGVGVVLSVVGVVFVVERPGRGAAGPVLPCGGPLHVRRVRVVGDLHHPEPEPAPAALRDRHHRLPVPVRHGLPDPARAPGDARSGCPSPSSAGLNLAYLAVFCSALSNFLYVYALSALGPIAVSPYINLIPVVGVLGGVVLLGETLVWSQVVGGAVILAGVLLVSRKRAGGPPIEG